jgi:hypothetical protein
MKYTRSESDELRRRRFDLYYSTLATGLIPFGHDA